MIVAGFGFRAAATPESLRDALTRAAGSEAGAIWPGRLATLAAKADAACMRDFAREAGLQVVAVSRAQAAGQATLTRSPAARAAHGTGSVAESCALAAAGFGARLLGPRVVSGDAMATCALAATPPKEETE